MTVHSSRIVVGYDGSPGAELALDWAAAEAARRDVPLLLVHAVHLPHLLTAAATDSAVVGALAVDMATVTMEAGIERARRMGATAVVVSETTRGTAARALVAASQSAALVVLGTRGRGTVAGELFGSVGVAVAAEAACPVVVVRGDPRPPGMGRPVVVGVDGSPESEIALRYAADVATAFGARLTVLTAWQRPGPRRITAPVPQLEGLELARQHRSVARETATAAADLAASLYPALTVLSDLREGRSEDVLAAEAEGAGLAVVGSRGRHGVTGLVLGSVSHALMHTAPCPVAVVRSG
jgi:nucleotide-binding universal stress UspA family protein